MRRGLGTPRPRCAALLAGGADQGGPGAQLRSGPCDGGSRRPAVAGRPGAGGRGRAGTGAGGGGARRAPPSSARPPHRAREDAGEPAAGRAAARRAATGSRDLATLRKPARMRPRRSAQAKAALDDDGRASGPGEWPGYQAVLTAQGNLTGKTRSRADGEPGDDGMDAALAPGERGRRSTGGGRRGAGWSAGLGVRAAAS